MKRRVGAVTPELREFILRRDKRCILAKLDPDHVCMDIWRNVHASDDLDRLTLEHVRTGGGMMGRRAPSDAAHLVALCGYANFSVPSKAQREAFREYLRAINRVTA